ncbi:MAG: TonB-dependent receptor [Bacteroidetes bacterium]|nr:TonB-dependent receptor [Bacteroidota bacterium]
MTLQTGTSLWISVLYCFFFAVLVPYSAAQIPDLEIELDGTVANADSLSADDTTAVVAAFRVYPIRMHPVPGSVLIENDSTLRWNHWLEWSDKLSRKAGVITYRQGGLNRTDYILMDGLGLSDQRLYVEGMHTHNALTGNAMYQHISLERLSAAFRQPAGLSQRTDIEFQRMYLRRPRTRVRYEQSSFELRSTEVQLAQMATHRLGLELMYHGKNYNGEYQRALTESRQMSARAWYHISERYVAQAMILYNGIQLQESGGYTIQNLATFNFSRFFANPVNAGATSSVRQSQVQIALMRRERARSDSLHSRKADTRLLMYYDRYRRSYTSNTDLSSFRYQGIHAAGQHALRYSWVDTRAELRASYYHLIPSQNPSVDINNWSTLTAELRGHIQPPVPGRFEITFPFILRSEPRSDNVHDWEVSGGVLLIPTDLITLHGGLSVGQKAPSIQQRYWSGQLRGTPDLQESVQRRLTGGITVKPSGGSLLMDATVFTHAYDHMFVLRSDSTFGRIADMSQWGARLSADWSHPSWEMHISSTVQQYRSDNPALSAQLLSGSGLRIWNRASVHWKGRVLSDAAFIKTGLYAILSGNPYRPAAYIPSADYWEGSIEVPEIPGFVRIDADLSARVRTIMFLLRWENVTQGLLQNGYYESAVYPMPSRRLRFGLRVYFTN